MLITTYNEVEFTRENESVWNATVNLTLSPIHSIVIYDVIVSNCVLPQNLQSISTKIKTTLRRIVHFEIIQ